MMNSKQIEGLKKLAVSPAFQNRAGSPIGVAKHHDGSTFNGNMIYNLNKAGMIVCVETGEIRKCKNYSVRIIRYEITETGRNFLAGFNVLNPLS